MRSSSGCTHTALSARNVNAVCKVRRHILLSLVSLKPSRMHTDVCGPVEVPSVSGYRYFMAVIDDHSRFCVLYLLKEKTEVATKIEE